MLLFVYLRFIAIRNTLSEFCNHNYILFGYFQTLTVIFHGHNLKGSHILHTHAAQSVCVFCMVFFNQGMTRGHNSYLPSKYCQYTIFKVPLSPKWHFLDGNVFNVLPVRK
jgi:hypothetical protein